jgi:hypothetical protein
VQMLQRSKRFCTAVDYYEDHVIDPTTYLSMTHFILIVVRLTKGIHFVMRGLPGWSAT